MSLTDTYFDNIRTIQTNPNGVDAVGQSDGVPLEVAQDIGYATETDYQAALNAWRESNHPGVPRNIGNTALSRPIGVGPLPVNTRALSARQSVRGGYDAATAAHPEQIPEAYTPLDDASVAAYKDGIAQGRSDQEATEPKDTSTARKMLAQARVRHQIGTPPEQPNMQELRDQARQITERTGRPHTIRRDNFGEWRITPDSPDQVA